MVRVCIIGAGSLGCFFGSRLALRGANVTLLKRSHSAKHVAGSDVVEKRAEILVKELAPKPISKALVNVRFGPEELKAGQEEGKEEIVLVCVKHKDTASVGEILNQAFFQNCIGKDTVVVSLQNGVGNVEILNSKLEGEAKEMNVVQGLTYQGVSFQNDFQVQHNGKGKTLIGCGSVSGSDSFQNSTTKTKTCLTKLATLFNRDNDEEEEMLIQTDIDSIVWTKLLANTIINPLTAIFHKQNGFVNEHHLNKIVQEACDEFIKVSNAQGVDLNLKDGMSPVDFVRSVAAATSSNTSSMFADIKAGNKTEIDSMNGYLINRAKEHGIDVPIHQSLYSLVKVLEK